MKPKNENAKDPAWNVPVKLPSVKPEEYSKSIDSGRGSAIQNAGKSRPDSGPPDYTIPGHHSNK